jgi:protein O-GlcNAc transferase
LSAGNKKEGRSSTPAKEIVDARFRRAMAFFHQGSLSEAESVCREILQEDPRSFDAHLLSGLIALQKKGFRDGLTRITQAIQINPNIAAAHSNLGYALRELGRLEEAVQSYERAISLKPDLVEAHNNRGIALIDLDRPSEALASFDRAIALRSNYSEAYNNRGIALDHLRRYAEAIECFDKAILLNSAYAEAHCNRGAALRALSRRDEALQSYERAIKLKPYFADAHASYGSVLLDLKLYDEALSSFNGALAISPQLIAGLVGRGNVFAALRRYEDAVAAYKAALTLNPNLAEAWAGLGNVLGERLQFNEALSAYEKALALNAELVPAIIACAGILCNLKRYPEAVRMYDKALMIEPNSAYAKGSRLHAKMLCCDWSNFDQECSRIIADINSGMRTALPFGLLSIESTASDQFKCAKAFSSDLYPMRKPLCTSEYYRHDRIRIAYLSSDFRTHAIAYLISEMLELHDRNRFDIFGISFGPNDQSEIRSRIVRSFDRFHDVTALSDEAVAELLHKSQIDIAVDLNNYSELCRPGILCHRPAPIQVSYLGFPATMASGSIDYAIADKVVLPHEQHRFWTEKIVFMPDCYLAHDTKSKRSMPLQVPARHQVGLPAKAFVFCCFNNSYKLNPKMFAIWMRIIKAVDRSVIWLSTTNDDAVKNLRKEAIRTGVDPDRLIFAPRTESFGDHLARQRVADVFLDTLPYNAHTTAADALWAGLPVVTCRGATFPGRVAASMLDALGLPELVADSGEQYEALALRLAREPAYLSTVRAKLTDNRRNHPLFNTVRFTRHLEQAYLTMIERHRSGQSPRSFSVDPIH